jgi:hypothetical protein
MMDGFTYYEEPEQRQRLRQAEVNFSGWLGRLADDSADARQFAARMATECLGHHGLNWSDVARLIVREIARRGGGR